MSTALRRLVAAGLLDETAAGRAERLAVAAGEATVAALARLGLVAEEDMAGALARAEGLDLAGTDGIALSPLARRLSPAFLERHLLAPVEGPGGPALLLADPTDSFARAAAARSLGQDLPVRVGTVGAVLALLRGEAPPSAAAAPPAGGAADGEDAARLRDGRREEPAIRLLDELVEAAVDRGASDIHLEPERDRLCLRLRVDGQLVTHRSLLPDLAAALVARLKVLARLDVAERRMPQDGRCRLAVRGRPVDLRVSILPTLFGEGAVLRVLDKAAQARDLGALGLPPAVAGGLGRLAGLPHGLVLVAGPTGSGKTTTLYALLGQVLDGTRKVVTVEDPVEFDLPGVTQVQVNHGIGLDFARILRSVLRHDPDVLMVGEVRDGETARTAVQAALTGHLVLATVHANGAVESVARLVDMGVEPYLLAGVLRGALSQRLVRKLCPHCRQREPVPAALRDRVGMADWYRQGGCPACHGRGHAGRVPVAELLVADAGFCRAVAEGAGPDGLRAAAEASGFRDLREEGLAQVAAGTVGYAELVAALGAGD